ncbi:hypothetical protein [uncultured Ruminococcus sp.]|uniref:hypothetical protein n=1 Tax=uncultured Ruminococcus sp. TaxID=165186 RepID=UPI0025F8879E|nr:hypothetical protein [uncultured Ruminococcus sp.]
MRGARGAEPLASGNGKATIRAIRLGEQSVDGKRSKHSTKASQKRAIRKEKRVLNSREQHSPCAGGELPACASRIAIASSAVVAQLLSRNGELSRHGQQFNG